MKSLEDFYNSLRGMPLKVAEKALNKFSHENEQNNIVICGFSENVNYLNVMKDFPYHNAFSINEIEKALEPIITRRKAFKLVSANMEQYLRGNLE